MFIAKAAPSVINCGTNRMLCHFKVLCGWLGLGFFSYESTNLGDVKLDFYVII